MHSKLSMISCSIADMPDKTILGPKSTSVINGCSLLSVFVLCCVINCSLSEEEEHFLFLVLCVDLVLSDKQLQLI